MKQDGSFDVPSSEGIEELILLLLEIETVAVNVVVICDLGCLDCGTSEALIILQKKEDSVADGIRIWEHFTDLETLEVEVEDFCLMLQWLQCNIKYHNQSDTQYCRQQRLLEASLMTTFLSI